MTNDDPFSSFYGKRFSVSGKDFDDGNGNGHDEQDQEESITPIADEELRPYEVGGNGHDDNREEEKKQVSTDRY